jgi:Bacterial PH domain
VTEDAVTVFRPRRARLVIYPVVAVFLALFGTVAVLLPETWGIGSRLGVVAFAVVVAGFLQRLAAVRIVARDRSVDVVNILHSRRLEWAEIVGVRLLRDDPWLMLDLADGYAMAAMGVQKSDGDYAREQAQRFAALVNAHTRTEQD